MRSVEVPPVARRQGGAFTVAQAADAGWSVRQIRRRCAQRHWVRLTGRVLIACDGERTALAWAWAATLSHPRVMISHQTAAALLDLPVPAFDGAHVVVPDGWQDPPTGVVVHQVPLVAADVATRGGLRVTSRWWWTCCSASSRSCSR